MRVCRAVVRAYRACRLCADLCRRVCRLCLRLCPVRHRRIRFRRNVPCVVCKIRYLFRLPGEIRIRAGKVAFPAPCAFLFRRHMDCRVRRVRLQLRFRGHLCRLPGRIVYAGQHVSAAASGRARLSSRDHKVQHRRAFRPAVDDAGRAARRPCGHGSHRHRGRRARLAFLSLRSGLALRSLRSGLSCLTLRPLRALRACLSLRALRALRACLARISLRSLRPGFSCLTLRALRALRACLSLRALRTCLARISLRSLQRAVVLPGPPDAVPDVDHIRRLRSHAVCAPRLRRCHGRLQRGQRVIISQHGKAAARLALRASQRLQPLFLRACVPVLHGDAVRADVISVRLCAAVCRSVCPGVPAHVFPVKRVEHLQRILVPVVLPVCKVDHGDQIRPVQLVVRRPHQQLRVRLCVVCDALRNVQQHHFRLHKPFALVQPLRFCRVGKCVRLDLVHRCNHAF